MEFKEKLLYHQIHPLKLFVDFSTGFVTTYLAWNHNVVWFLALFLAPSVIVTLLLLKFADLESLKATLFGNYVAKYMSRTMEMIRLAGQMLMWIAGWFHFPIAIGIGFLIIIGGWLFGFLLYRIKR